MAVPASIAVPASTASAAGRAVFIRSLLEVGWFGARCLCDAGHASLAVCRLPNQCQRWPRGHPKRLCDRSVGNRAGVHVQARGETRVLLECTLPTEVGYRPHIGERRVGERERRGPWNRAWHVG